MPTVKAATGPLQLTVSKLRSASESVADKAGINPKELNRFLKFACVGVIGAVVDFGSFNLLVDPLKNGVFSDAQTATTVAASISFVLAILSNFIWNRFWTYKDSRSKAIWSQFVQFFIVNVSGLVIRAPIVYLTALPFARFSERFLEFLPVTPTRLGDNLAVALSVGIVMFWNFFANRYWTYNDVD